MTLDSASPTAAGLALIYEAIQIKCDACSWQGSPTAYRSHVCVTPFITTEDGGVAVVTPRSGLVIALEDFEGGDGNVMPVKQGELLELTAESDSGWAFVTKKENNQSGWTPAAYLSPTCHSPTLTSSSSEQAGL